MLGDDDFGHAGRRHSVLVLVDAVILRTVDEGHDVGVLLDGARLTQVGELGALRPAAHLRGTAQLRQGDHRHVQLLGDGLERTRNEGHLLLAVPLRILVAGHQLQVVDDNDLDVVVYLQAARLRTELEDRERRRIVDEQRRRTQRFGRRLQVAPLLGRQAARFHVVAVEPRLGDDQTHHQLHRGHFEREKRHALLVVYGHIARHREHEGRLTHRRAGCDDDQIGELPAQRHTVYGHETRRNAVEGARVLRRLLDLHQRPRQDILRHLHRTLYMPLGDLEYLAFGIPDQLRHIGRFVVRAFLYLSRRAYQLALHVFLGDDLGMELDVGRRAYLLRKLRQVRRPAHLLELLLAFQPLGHGIEVDRFELHRQLLDRLVDRAVLLRVERIGRHILLHGDDAVLFEHQRAEYGLLQFDRLRGYVPRGLGERLECLPVAPGGVIIFCHDIRFRSKAKSSNKPGEFKTPPGDILPKTMF